MAKWLFNSQGEPIAFAVDDRVYAAEGGFVGRLDGDEVWHGRYKGELVKGDRFLYKIGKGSVVRGTPGTPGQPGIPGRPGHKGSLTVSGYRDVDLSKGD